MNIDVLLVFGGTSPEHEIAVLTAAECERVLKRIDGVRVHRLLVARDGAYYDPEPDTPTAALTRLEPCATCRPATLQANGLGLTLEAAKGSTKIDVVFPVFHGVGGEDGSVQGLCQFAHVPCVGSGIAASAIGIDKDIQKRVLASHSIPVLPHRVIDCSQSLSDEVRRVTSDLSPPYIIKPARLGSSIGIQVAESADTLLQAVESAGVYDRKLVVEAYLVNKIELNCAVLGPEPLRVSECERPLGAGRILSFLDKYGVDGGKHGSKGGITAMGIIESKREFPARIPPELRERVRSLAARCYAAIDAAGVIRVDFLCTSEAVYVNEVNTIPGSLAMYLWGHDDSEHKGIFEFLLRSALAQGSLHEYAVLGR